MPRKVWVIFLVMLGTALSSCFSEEEPADSSSGNASPLCFFSGESQKPKYGTKGFNSLGSMLRVHLDARTLPDCLQAVSSYCRDAVLLEGNVLEHGIGFYQGTYHGRRQSKTEFNVLRNCSVIEGHR